MGIRDFFKRLTAPNSQREVIGHRPEMNSKVSPKDQAESKKRHEEKQKQIEARRAKEQERQQTGKTLDATFVRRFVDENGQLVQEFDYGAPLGEDGEDGRLVRWQRAPGEVGISTKANSDKRVAVRGFKEVANVNHNSSGEVVKYGQIIEVDGRRKGIDGGHDVKKTRAIDSGNGQEVIRRGNSEVILPVKPVEVPQYEKQNYKIVIADITPIVERYARTLAEQKVHDKLNNSGFFKKSWVRLSEAGYVEKYFQEAKAEILNNRNLLSDIEAKLANFKKSPGKRLAADAEDIHYEIIDKIIEAYQDELLDRNTRSAEVKQESVKDSRLDAEAANLIVDFVFGKVSSRQDFDKQVEDRLVPILGNAGAKQGGDRMYANSLFDVAQGYKKQVQEKLGVIAEEFGPEQRDFAEKFIRGTLQLDVKLGEKGADLYQKRPEAVMKWYEKHVDHMQKGSVLGWAARKLLGEETGGKIGRVAGKVLANPVLYAALGNITGRGAAKALGAAGGYGLGVAAGIAFMPATLAVLGTGIAAGSYIGWRAAREKRRDIARREQEAVLGLRETETHNVWKIEELMKNLQELQKADRILTDEEKKHVGEIQARLDLQSQFGVDLVGVGKEAGEKYKSKFVAEVELRKALKEFWKNKGLQYGKDPAEMAKNYRSFQADAERALTSQIEKVNKDKADQIRSYGWKKGAIGGAVAMGAAVAGPLVGKGIKMGANYFGAGFDVSKATYLEEAWHQAQEKLGYGHPDLNYGGTLLPQTIAGVGGRFNLPPGFGLRDMGMDHGNHVVAIVDSHGSLVPGGDHIAVDASGHVVDPHALDGLKGSGWNIHETPGTAGTGTGGAYNESELKAMGFGIHKRADWHHIHDSLKELSKHIFNGKELEAYKQVLPGGNEQWDASKILHNMQDNAEQAKLLEDLGKFGVDNQGNIDPKMMALKEQLVGWYKAGGNEGVAKHLVMRVIASEHDNQVTGLTKVFQFDSHGHLNLPHEYANAAYKEIALVDDSGHSHILATEHLGGGGMLKTGGAGTPGAIDFRSPHEMEDVWALAGSRRETDADLEKKKQKELEDKKKKEQKAKGGHDKHGSHDNHDDHGQKDKGEKPKGVEDGIPGTPEQRSEKAFEEIKPLVDSKDFDLKKLSEVAEKWKIEKDGLVIKCLEHKNIDFKANEAQVLPIAKEFGNEKPSKFELAWIMFVMAQAGFEFKPIKAKVADGATTAEGESTVESPEDDGDDDEKKDKEAARANTFADEKGKGKAADGKPEAPKGNTKNPEQPKANGGTAKPEAKKNGAETDQQAEASYNEVSDRIAKANENKVHFVKPDGKVTAKQWNLMKTTLLNLEKALQGLDSKTRNGILNKTNGAESETKMKKGLIIELSVNGKPEFKKDRIQLDRLPVTQDVITKILTKKKQQTPRAPRQKAA